MLQWINYSLFYENEEKDLIDSMRSFLSVCREIGLNVHSEKSILFAEFQFHGRIISAQGI